VKDIKEPNWFKEVSKSQGFSFVLEAWYETLISPYKSVVVLVDVKIIGSSHLGWWTCYKMKIFGNVYRVLKIKIKSKPQGPQCNKPFC
jgi:hypothetical protein